MNISAEATATKINGSISSFGGPDTSRSPKVMSWLRDARMSTGKKRMKATRATSTIGVHGKRSRSVRPARRNPSPMPRNDPSSTKFEK
jgi:hypothetical protein